jgi:hypothetical protein
MTDRQIAAVSSTSPITDTFLIKLGIFISNPSIEELCFAATLASRGFSEANIIDVVGEYRRILTESKSRDNDKWYDQYKKLDVWYK